MDGLSCKSFQCSDSNRVLKEFLIDSVRMLSRVYTRKTKGQQKIWDNPPEEWPCDLSWKNPTEHPKDTVIILQKKYDFLISKVPSDSFTDAQMKAFEDFKNKDMYSVKCFMILEKCKKQCQDFERTIVKHKSLFHTTPSHPVINNFVYYFDSFTKNVSSLIHNVSNRNRNEECLLTKTSRRKAPIKHSNVNTHSKGKHKFFSRASNRPILPKSSDKNAAVVSGSKIVCEFSAVGSFFVNTAPNAGSHQPSSSKESSNGTNVNCFSSVHQPTHCAMKGYELICQTSDRHCSHNVKGEENSTQVDCGWNVASGDLIEAVDVGNKSQDSNMTRHIQGTGIVFNNAKLKSPSVQNLLEEIFTLSCETEHGNAS